MNGEPGRRIGVLISGRGSNLKAILDAVQEARLRATVAIVVSNVEGAPGLSHAAAAGVPTLTIDHRRFPTRAAFDGAVLAALRAHEVDLVCLAGFMRLLGPTVVDAYRHAILNVHPSLLPAFPGLHAQRQAWLHGAKVSGATVHLVDTDLDTGPIVRQACVPVRDDDTEETLAARVLVQEHRIYPEAIGLWLDGGWRIEGRRFVVPLSPSGAEVPLPE